MKENCETGSCEIHGYNEKMVLSRVLPMAFASYENELKPGQKSGRNSNPRWNNHVEVGSTLRLGSGVGITGCRFLIMDMIWYIHELEMKHR